MTYTNRERWSIVALLPALLACGAAAGAATFADAPSRDAAVAMRIGRRCADELAELARRSPESALRGLAVDRTVPAGASQTVPERVSAEISRRLAALADASGEASSATRDAALAASKARALADRLCQARDATFTLTGMSRAARELPTGAVAATTR